MKNEIFFELLNRLKSRPQLRRKLKVFAMVGVLGFFIAGGLTVWAGLSAVGYVAAKANQAAQSPAIQDHIENVKTTAREFESFRALDCWAKTQNLFSVQPWLERTVLDNLANLKVACLEQKPSVCEGNDCAKLKQLMQTAEGKTL